MLYSVVDNRMHIQVDTINHIGNITMNEHLAGFQPHYLIGVYSAIGAPYIKKIGILLCS